VDTDATSLTGITASNTDAANTHSILTCFSRSGTYALGTDRNCFGYGVKQEVSDTAAVQAKGAKDGTLSAPMRDQLNSAARIFADELVNSDYSRSKFLHEHVHQYEDDKHLNGAARDYLARQIAADNTADRANAEQDARLHPPATGMWDKLKGALSNSQLEEKKIIPKVVLGGTNGHADVSGLIDAPYEHPVEQAPTPAPAPPPHRDRDYTNTAIDIERAWQETINPAKK
jgi:hypothetical protein